MICLIDIKDFINQITTIDISHIDLNKYTQYDLEYFCYYLGINNSDCDIFHDKSSNLAVVTYRPTQDSYTCWIGDGEPSI